ncbi:hypothetical protein, partial [Psychrobacter phenylpyruvicus]|uniref:hypothetical protein n=1 Tax=Psychrobacter phenylpyruvicus TaxID=29432 RepID=UPI000AC8ED49
KFVCFSNFSNRSLPQQNDVLYTLLTERQGLFLVYITSRINNLYKELVNGSDERELITGLSLLFILRIKLILRINPSTIPY